MFKVVHAITAAVPFRATATPRVSVAGAVCRQATACPRQATACPRQATACPRPALRAHWVRVVSVDGVPRLVLRWDIMDPTTMLDPDVSIPALPLAA